MYILISLVTALPFVEKKKKKWKRKFEINILLIMASQRQSHEEEQKIFQVGRCPSWPLSSYGLNYNFQYKHSLASFSHQIIQIVFCLSIKFKDFFILNLDSLNNEVPNEPAFTVL